MEINVEFENVPPSLMSSRYTDTHYLRIRYDGRTVRLEKVYVQAPCIEDELSRAHHFYCITQASSGRVKEAIQALSENWECSIRNEESQGTTEGDSRTRYADMDIAFDRKTREFVFEAGSSASFCLSLGEVRKSTLMECSCVKELLSALA